jgi:Endonuclease V
MPADRHLVGTTVVWGEAAAPYRPGLLALREGPSLEAAIRALSARPEVVIANATGRDHPRGAGLAINLGAVLDLPSVGVTDRPLLAAGAEPSPSAGTRARSCLKVGRAHACFARAHALGPSSSTQPGALTSRRPCPWCSRRSGGHALRRRCGGRGFRPAVHGPRIAGSADRSLLNSDATCEIALFSGETATHQSPS